MTTDLIQPTSKRDPSETPGQLTARFVETVKPKDNRVDYPDSHVRGLSLRVTPRGVKSWSVRYRRKSDSRQRRFTIGPYPALCLKDARSAALECMADVARGFDPAGEVEKRKSELVFAEVADQWLHEKAASGRSEKYVRDNRSMLEVHILPIIGGMRVSEISKGDIIEMMDLIGSAKDARVKKPNGEPRKMSTRPRKVFEQLRTICNWAFGRDLMPTNPIEGITPPAKGQNVRERYLTPDELRIVWAKLSATNPTGYEIFERRDDSIVMSRNTAFALMFSLITAQRIGEVCNITASELHLDADEPYWDIPAERAKNSQPHRVPLSKLAVRVITEAHALSGKGKYVFRSPGTDRPIREGAPAKAVNRSKDFLGVAPFVPHDLRRTAATNMAALGVPLHVISAVLNHKSVNKGTITGRVYVHYEYLTEKREALNKWDAFLRETLHGIGTRCVK